MVRVKEHLDVWMLEDDDLGFIGLIQDRSMAIRIAGLLNENGVIYIPQDPEDIFWS